MSEFIWNDETAKEFLTFGRTQPTFILDDYLIQKFKESKQPKPEYEILSFNREGQILYNMDGDTFDSVVPNSSGLWYVGTLNKLLEDKVPINSVKRLSDSEVFSIGDKLSEGDIIDAFWLNYEGNSLWVSTNQKERYGICFESAKKAPQPIPLTKDQIIKFLQDNL